MQKQVITDKNNLEKRFYDYENKKFEDEEKILRVCDIKTLSFNQLENVRLKFKKVFRVLNSYFPKREDIDEFLKKQLHLDHEEYSQVSLSQKNLCKIFQGFFLNIEDKVNKKDLEGFLSVLNYNEYGFAKANNISNTIYKYLNFYFL